MLPFRLGPMEIVLILAVVMIVFGVGRLPEVFGGLGKGIREFKKATIDEEETKKPEPVAPATSDSAKS